MPHEFRPAVRAGLARGLRVIQGEAAQSARAKALRAAAKSRVRPQYTVIGSEGPERMVLGAKPMDEALAATRASVKERAAQGARYSPKATSEQAARAEALKRHAKSRRAVDELNDFLDVGDELSPDQKDVLADYAERQLRGRLTPGASDAETPLLRAFEERYGWRPATEEEARSMLSPSALEELGFPPDL